MNRHTRNLVWAIDDRFSETKLEDTKGGYISPRPFLGRTCSILTTIKEEIGIYTFESYLFSTHNCDVNISQVFIPHHNPDTPSIDLFLKK